jgi:3-hydroxyacyl-[acyl-carrier-protein] dehydratase
MISPSCKELLPHRYPFLLVDRVLDFEAGASIRGLKYVSENDRLSFAAAPALLSESLAQLSKILETIAGSANASISFLAQVQIDFLAPILPGMAIELSARREKQHGEMVCYAVCAEADGQRLAQGRIFRRRNA